MKKIIYIVSLLLCAALAHGLEITEVMYNPEGSDYGREWVEIYVYDEINLSELEFMDNGGSQFLYVEIGDEIISDSYVVIADDVGPFLVDHPGFSGTLATASFMLNNGGEEIGIKHGDYVLDNVSYPTDIANGNGKSAEKIGNLWLESIVMGGTPGYSENQVPEFSGISAIALLGLCLLGVMKLRKPK